ncbi:hypothetical protein GCM10008927_20700 [Amylibacter ulvae]|uniref:Type IV pilus biogenesis protein PilP n=1 Tax=Paramylibacter ulvae TaxID=1651968 RepID=A0ABQ3D244_9RHOB|nr:hypothetical protein [Amylibacter ulvae]GHA54756.1 hypothetical protein GCM10008927_20700 [Amylibacter ulvae]
MKIRPNYALELSNERVCLLHRATDDVWIPLIETQTDAPDFKNVIKDMRKQAQPVPAMPARVAVMIPTSEVLFTTIDETDETTVAHKISTLTNIPAERLVICMAEMSCENNVAAVDATTLEEAATYAQTLGFSPSGYTSRWRQFGFSNEPVFQPPIAPRNIWNRIKPALATVGMVMIGFGIWQADWNVDADTSETIPTQPIVADITINASVDAVQKRPVVRNIVPTDQATLKSVIAHEKIKGVKTTSKAISHDFVRLAALEPSINGTISPDGFTLFSGKPSVLPPSRVEPDADQPRPKMRPAHMTTDEKPETASTPTVLDTAPQVTDVLPVTPLDSSASIPAQTVVETTPVTEPKPETSAPEVDLLALANPELAKYRPKMRDHADTPAPVETPVAVQTDSPVSPIDPEQQAVVPETPQDPVVDMLALANPELAGERPRARPSGITTNAPAPSMLDRANPALRGYAPKSRPKQFTATVAPVAKTEPTVAPEPAQPQYTTAEIAAQRARAAEQARLREIQSNIAKASRSAIRVSPFPPRKSSSFARTVAKTKKEQIKLASAPATQTKRESVTTRGTPSKVFQKNQLSLVGVFGTPKQRRALFRTPGGRYVTLKNGERVSGWKLSGIGESSVKITKGSRNRTLLITK